MAETIVNARLGDRWQAFSAGTRPAGFVHPKAIAALAEIGIQHHGRSKLADEFREADLDVVVTVCDSAAEECPIWVGKGKRIHHSFPDPAKAPALAYVPATATMYPGPLIEIDPTCVARG